MNLFPMIQSGLYLFMGIVLYSAALSPCESQAYNTSPPSQPVRLIFIHHSTGQNWLSDDNGELAIALRDNNYFVSDTNYGWGPDGVGNNTDIGHWWTWFRGPSSSTYLTALYAESDQTFDYTRLADAPAGENEIVMFKSCFPNSALQGNISDPIPPIGSNHLRGEGSGSEYHTISNAKGIYMDLLNYFMTRQDKLFIVITAPPLSDPTYAANARAFNQWIVNNWLAGYPYHNVAVFDFYNVLTTNGGNRNTNDLGIATGNHHRWYGGAIQHKTDGDNDANPNVLEYPSGDDHPSQAGNLKATGEFIPLLNIFYNSWKDTGNMACVEGTPMDCYPSLQSAYDHAGNRGAILVKGVTFNEDLTASSTNEITITGGYNSDYSSVTGFATLNGTLTVSNGTLTLENLVIAPAGI
jgi:hypothetical protein